MDTATQIGQKKKIEEFSLIANQLDKESWMFGSEVKDKH